MTMRGALLASAWACAAAGTREQLWEVTVPMRDVARLQARHDVWSLDQVGADQALLRVRAREDHAPELEGFGAVMIAGDVRELHHEQAAGRRAARALEEEEVPWHESYHTYDEFMARYRAIPESDAGKAVYATVRTLGTSHEGRDIIALNIGRGSRTGVWDCGVHAREWLNPAVCSFVVEKIIELAAGGDEFWVRAFESITLTVVPLANPDGYVYTWSDDGDRYWRKNRRDNGDGSFGVDLNRNFGYKWGTKNRDSTSRDTNAYTYLGPSAFSEPESRAVKQAFEDAQAAGDAMFGVSWHAFSQVILIPWGYCSFKAHIINSYQNDVANCTEEGTLPVHSELPNAAARISQAIKTVHNKYYKTGNPIDLIGYGAAGASDEWYFSSMNDWGIAFTPELRPPAGASAQLSYFDPHPREIVPTGEEWVAGVKELFDYVMVRPKTRPAETPVPETPAPPTRIPATAEPMPTSVPTTAAPAVPVDEPEGAAAEGDTGLSDVAIALIVVGVVVVIGGGVAVAVLFMTTGKKVAPASDVAQVGQKTPPQTANEA